MTECERCARISDLYLCPTCIEEVQWKLHDLPWWLDRLAETAIGQTRIADTGPKTRRRDVLHGDTNLTAYIQPFPSDRDEPPTKGDRIARQQAALRHALAAVRADPRASDEYHRIHNTLTTWVETICQTHNIDPPTLNTAPAAAKWLEAHAHKIAHKPRHGKQFCEQIDTLNRAIERIISRPNPKLILGPCTTDPAPTDILKKRAQQNDATTRCNLALEANKNTQHITCPRCKQTHQAEDVLTANLAEQDENTFTVRELTDWVLPRLDEPVPISTLKRWITKSLVPVRGYDADGAQMVKLGDVREVRRNSRRRNRKAG